MTRKDAPPPAERLAEISQVTDRARAGDPTAVPRLVELLDEFGYLATYFGDLGVVAAATWISLIAGSDLLLRESLAARVDALRKELGGENPGPIAELLVDRVILSWLAANHAVCQEGMSLSRGENPKLLALRTKRRIQAERAHIAALGALATFTKLSPPPLKAAESGKAASTRPVPASPRDPSNRVSGFFDDLLGPTGGGRKNPPVVAN